MRITSKGQVTIPADIRQRAGLLPNTEVEFEFIDKIVRLKKVKNAAQRGKRLIQNMKGRATVNMTTDDILALTRG
ncbi:AbrB family transcriptional regulator [Smithella sp. SC_K08D17]|jgi:AbrB family looped-hinge helix DNA binding protein|nr:AbrB family transcriptional regulator [Smithella sp. SC_K08D17]